MNLDAFERSLAEPAPPENLPPLLLALWREAKGNWHSAHEIAQAEAGPDAAWVHAYLHRVEGDEANAGYWYRRAGRPHPDAALADERREIATALLGRT